MNRFFLQYISKKTVSVFGFFGILYTFYCLYIYKPTAISYLHSSNGQAISNFLSQYAAFLFYLFGGVAWYVLIIFLYVGYLYYSKEFLYHKLEKIASAFLTVPILSWYLYVYNCDYIHGFTCGGLLGHWLYEKFSCFDQVVVYAGMTCIWTISFFSIAHYLFLKGVEFFFRTIQFLNKIFYTIPMIKKIFSIIVFCIKNFIFYPVLSFFAKMIYLVDCFIFGNIPIIFPEVQCEKKEGLSDECVHVGNISNQEVPSIEKNIDAFEQPCEIEQVQSFLFESQDIEFQKKKKKIAKEYRVTLQENNTNDTYAVKQLIHDQQAERAKALEQKLEKFGITGTVVKMNVGPVVTLFEYKPESDIKLSKILSLEDDLAMALQAISIRIIAPIPGTSVVGFEVANDQRASVFLSTCMHTTVYKNFSGALPIVLGQDTTGNTVVVDLASMPHLLVAGSTGAGKSVALNTMLISLLYKLSPEQLRLILIDPKRLEFASYADIGHLEFPIVTDARKVAPVLKWVVHEMEQRYEQMSQCGVRNIADYNDFLQKKSEKLLPILVVIIDELADLMLHVGKDVENLITRIAQMARAAGIHMIIATQRPSVDVITGLIKANFPSRISFRVTSRVDSRTILDAIGAEKLLGKGDSLFLNASNSQIQRIHGAYISDKEIDSIVRQIRELYPSDYKDLSIALAKVQQIEDEFQEDELSCQINDFLQDIDEISISLLQRKFKIGYNRSARIIDILESQGKILPPDGSKMRKVIK